MHGTLGTLAVVEDPSGKDAGSGRADTGSADTARKVVWAFDTPPSQRQKPPGMNAASPLLDGDIELLYGPRYRDSWVAVFDRSGWEAPPGPNSAHPSVLERVHFLVGGDIHGKEQLFEVLHDVPCDSVAGGMARTPYVLWHMVDRDVLWRAGVVPITRGQVPDRVVVHAGNANQSL
jgi:hypothetical protein